jgi:hypothetical protein
MLQIENQTPFEADRGLFLDADGNHIWVVAIKGAYDIGSESQMSLCDRQEPVSTAPIWMGEPGNSSLLRENELTVAHPGTDVTFNATAYAGEGKAVGCIDVGVMVRDVKKVLRIFGDRTWQLGLAGLEMSPPQLFEQMPIVWERAFGGTQRVEDSDHPRLESRNPIGRGFAITSTRALGKPLPNVEDAHHLIRHWKDRPPPCGLGAIPSHWAPRCHLGGTYDERWRRNRMPLWPKDYDPRFFQSTVGSFAFDKPLKGGERIWAMGLLPEGLLDFYLPREYWVVETRLAGKWFRQSVQLERVIVEPDTGRLVMVWGSRLNCGVLGREVEKSRILQKPLMKW